MKEQPINERNPLPEEILQTDSVWGAELEIQGETIIVALDGKDEDGMMRGIVVDEKSCTEVFQGQEIFFEREVARWLVGYHPATYVEIENITSGGIVITKFYRPNGEKVGLSATHVDKSTEIQLSEGTYEIELFVYHNDERKQPTVSYPYSHTSVVLDV